MIHKDGNNFCPVCFTYCLLLSTCSKLFKSKGVILIEYVLVLGHVDEWKSAKWAVISLLICDLSEFSNLFADAICEALLTEVSRSDLVYKGVLQCPKCLL